ncbi:MAG TPA: signal peptidase I [Vicinamibacterales bacterium]|jgi:signal peptidase I|nr:signal peptidase I [Vicinamibacterales bacterium]
MVATTRLRLSRAARWIHLVLVAAGAVVIVATYGIRFVRVTGFSMAPTLNNGDVLLIDSLDYELGDPQIGDIAILYYPASPSHLFIKRIIATAGDTVRVTNGRAYVNGQLKCDQYVPVSFRSADQMPTERVALGYYFVMGDHRNDSSDSREWGLVPRRYVLGKARVRWWPIRSATIF